MHEDGGILICSPIFVALKIDKNVKVAKFLKLGPETALDLTIRQSIGRTSPAQQRLRLASPVIRAF